MMGYCGSAAKWCPGPESNSDGLAYFQGIFHENGHHNTPIRTPWIASSPGGGPGSIPTAGRPRAARYAPVGGDPPTPLATHVPAPCARLGPLRARRQPGRKKTAIAGLPADFQCRSLGNRRQALPTVRPGQIYSRQTPWLKREPIPFQRASSPRYRRIRLEPRIRRIDRTNQRWRARQTAPAHR
jgi:hypothetical protein